MSVNVVSGGLGEGDERGSWTFRLTAGMMAALMLLLLLLLLDVEPAWRSSFLLIGKGGEDEGTDTVAVEECRWFWRETRNDRGDIMATRQGSGINNDGP